jgi:hypothetical protein
MVGSFEQISVNAALLVNRTQRIRGHVELQEFLQRFRPEALGMDIWLPLSLGAANTRTHEAFK